MSVASATPSQRLLNKRSTNTPLRQSVAQTATISSTQSNTPDYIVPIFPLNVRGQDAIAALLRKYSTTAVEQKLQAANKALADCAGDINERYSDMKNAHEKNKKKRARDAADGEDVEPHNKEADEKLETLRVDVKSMTARMEKETRKAIDGYGYCIALDAAIASLQNTAHAASTQATQAPSSAITLPGSTLPPPGTAAPPSLAPALTEALEKHADKYTSISLTDRYTKHNDYIGFKQVVHDALHDPEVSSVPLPHPRTWFAAEEGAAPPQPGVTEPGNEDSDDDIAIDRERISTRCPITLREFEEPVKSKKCNHSFERTAILEMINQSRPQTAAERSRWVANVECPATGCHESLTKDDLTTDAVLVRRIRRIQRAKAREEEEGEMEGVGRSRDARGNAINVEEIESGDEVSDVDEVGDEENVKRESQRVRKRRVDDIED